MIEAGNITQLLWLLTWVLVMVVTVTSCRLLAWLPPELRVPHPDTTACTLASELHVKSRASNEGPSEDS